MYKEDAPTISAHMMSCDVLRANAVSYSEAEKVPLLVKWFDEPCLAIFSYNYLLKFFLFQAIFNLISFKKYISAIL